MNALDVVDRIRELLLTLPEPERSRALGRADICPHCGQDLRELAVETRHGHCERG